MAHDESVAGIPAAPAWHDDGRHITHGGQHFCRWWVAEIATLTGRGVAVAHKFYGYQGTDLVQIEGIEAAREFAAQLLAAIDDAELGLSTLP